MPRGGKRVGAGRKRTKPAKPAAAPKTLTPLEPSPIPETPAIVHPLLAKCTRKEQAFILNLIADPEGNQRHAYERAGFKARGASADANASKLLRKDRVRAAFDSMRTDILAKAQSNAELSAARVLEELRRVAFSDVRRFFDGRGNLRTFDQLAPEDAACLAGFEVIVKNAQAGDGKTDTVHKFKVWDKPRALEMLAKHFGLLAEKVDVTGSIDIVDVLRQRTAKRRIA